MDNNQLKNELCPVCHGKLFDDDDVVYCPDCGAPYHRDCFISLGHCKFEENHGTDKQWKPTEKKRRKRF